MKKYIVLLFTLIMGFLPVFAETSASSQFSVTIPSYVKVESVLSPVLIANITNRSGNLHSPLHTRFKVISNSHETTTLYLKSHVITDAGMENSMFQRGGIVYVAFGNMVHVPTSSALSGCKIGAAPKDSPGVVAYPITSVYGAEHKFDKDKYEVYVSNGVTNVDVNVGSTVLKDSFAPNDKKGFYQAILSLTEADI